jgi:glyoxylase-like metal-dependent hydrolase (beta-lactamase superfamily II)
VRLAGLLLTLAAATCSPPAPDASVQSDGGSDAAARSGVEAGATSPTYEVMAVRYATIQGYRVRNLVAGADSARTVDLAMMVWVLERSDGTAVLVDAGFHRPKFIERWEPADFVPPSHAVARAGIPPHRITDVILTHVHWDHVDGLDLFPDARVWIQRAEYDYYVDDDGTALQSGIDALDAEMLAEVRAEGRLEPVDGDAVEILPGITVYTGGRHTYASQYVGVRTAEGTVVVASDNCYLYENLERHAPIAQTFDAEANLAALDRMREIASDPSLIVPGHDPGLFERFAEPGGGVARIAGG